MPICEYHYIMFTVRSNIWECVGVWVSGFQMVSSGTNIDKGQVHEVPMDPEFSGQFPYATIQFGG